MMNAQLISLSREISLRRELDVVANNLANINTTGFQAESLLFEDYRMPVARASAFRMGDRPLAYVRDWATVRDTTAGRFEMTGNPLDVAIDGDAYLVVDTPEGERFTRNGSFQRSPDGMIVNQQGLPVMGLDGPIYLLPEDSEISIAPDGTVTTDNGPRGRLRLVEFDNEQAMERVGNNLLTGEDPQPSEFGRVMQGVIEGSNVQPISEISRMIEIQRAYEMQARMVRDADGLRRNAIERLGSLDA
ncbi:MAG: flagellar basal-body rod protein FlgF [Hyphomicrobiaceae bacterium]|nr:flagellar basal-body rod protein FlgF [Hyphomicrobiaceae bacterium]